VHGRLIACRDRAIGPGGSIRRHRAKMRAVIAKVTVGAADSHRIITANRDLAKDLFDRS
jgi:hypothetical protein